MTTEVTNRDKIEATEHTKHITDNDMIASGGDGGVHLPKKSKTWFPAQKGYFYRSSDLPQENEAPAPTDRVFHFRDDLNDAIESVTRRIRSVKREDGVASVPMDILREGSYATDDTSQACSSMGGSLTSLSHAQQESVTRDNDSVTLEDLDDDCSVETAPSIMSQSSLRLLDQQFNEDESVYGTDEDLSKIKLNDVLTLSPKVKSSFFYNLENVMDKALGLDETSQALLPSQIADTGSSEDIEVTFDMRGNTRVDGKIIAPARREGDKPKTRTLRHKKISLRVSSFHTLRSSATFRTARDKPVERVLEQKEERTSENKNETTEVEKRGQNADIAVEQAQQVKQDAPQDEQKTPEDVSEVQPLPNTVTEGEITSEDKGETPIVEESLLTVLSLDESPVIGYDERTLSTDDKTVATLPPQETKHEQTEAIRKTPFIKKKLEKLKSFSKLRFLGLPGSKKKSASTKPEPMLKKHEQDPPTDDEVDSLASESKSLDLPAPGIEIGDDKTEAAAI